MFCKMNAVERQLARLFYKLGVVVAKNPGYFLVVPFLVAALCFTGFQRMRSEIDPEYLFSPVGGQGKMERNVVESYFSLNYSARFNVGRITRPGRFGRVIVVPKEIAEEAHQLSRAAGTEGLAPGMYNGPGANAPGTGPYQRLPDLGNLLTAAVWDELKILDEIIKNATAVVDGERFKYSDVCARWVDECFRNDILELSHVMDDVESGKLNLTFPVMFNPVTWDAHAFPVFFGGTVVSDEGTILSVPSLQLVYFVTADTKRQDEIGAAWEEAFLKAVGEAEDGKIFKHISTARFASRTLDLELERNTHTVVPFFGTTFMVMLAFSALSCVMADWVRAKPWLGFLGNLSAVAGTAAAFGLVMYIGVPFIGINLAAPFLMLGIGIDDTFVMLAAWRRTSPLLEVPERLGRTLSEAAVSITITSVTDMLSFWIGIISPFPSVQIFCIYTGFAVGFTFLWHVTFFSACVAIFGYAEKKNLHSVTCVKVLPVSQADHRSWLYRMLCTGGHNPEDPHNPRDNVEHSVMVFFREKVAWMLNKPFIKVLVVIVFAGYLAGACYGITNIKEGLERRKLSRTDSYSIDFYDREDFYFREFPYRIQVVISGELNYSDPYVQFQIENLTQTFENTSFISSPLYTESWVRSFVGYVNRNKDYLNISIDTEEEFITSLKELWLFQPNPFSLDVKFNDDGSRIIASRFLIQAVNITDSNHEKEMVRALRQIAREASLNVTVFHPYFVFFDQFELVRPTSIQCMVIAAIVMMLISLVFIPSLLCCFWIAFSILSIETGVAGYMALWGVSLDSISMINLIMCIGFSIDFSAHICYSYMTTPAAVDTKEKVRQCLYALGLPIVQGAMSTVLSVVALAFAHSYIFLTFFKMVFLVILFGAMHGLLLLPVLLSLFGPGSCSSESIEGADRDEKKKARGDANGRIQSPMSPGEKGQPYGLSGTPPSSAASAAAVALQLGHGLRPGGQFLALGPPVGGITYLGNKFNQPLDLVSAKHRSLGTVPLEKDLGLGTSGEEESSESSSAGKSPQTGMSNSGGGSQQRLPWNRMSNGNSNPSSMWHRQLQHQPFQPPQLMEVYSNAGYMSDDEHQRIRKHERGLSRGRENGFRRESSDQRLHYSPDDAKFKGKVQYANHSNGALVNRLQSGYVGEMKFP
ncbi:patched domain-containing protein 3-like isoform X1 [Hetaerina americana]|uniref:patched domain-containing protein 3-like isoform X1 n=1 Tax=Hetaerina americana TaxID=62018 RepID=UPI003A7F5D60